MKTLSLSELKRRFEPGLALTLLLTLFAAIPLLSNPGLSDGADTLLHIQRAAEMNRLWAQGVFLPSWGDGFYWGYGSPLFHFYARLSYFLASIMRFAFGMSEIDALRWLLLLCQLTMSGGMYLFCRRRSGRLGGLIAGLVYVYSPYFLFTLPYARGAFPELLAFALFPLLLWRVDALRDRKTWYGLLLVVALQAALINAHNLMAVVLTGVVLLWLLAESLIQRINAEASQVDGTGDLLALLALLLGALASASFWLPIVLERESVSLATLLAFGYDASFATWKVLLTTPGPHDDGALNALSVLGALSIAQWGLAILGVGSLLIGYIRGYRSRHANALLGATIFALLGFALLALVSPDAKPLWDALPLLHLLQFPWRFVGPAAACLAIAASMNGIWLRRLPSSSQRGVIATAVALPIIISIPFFYVPSWSLSSVDASAAALHSSRFPGGTITDEFRPRDVHTLPGATSHLLADFADGYPVDKMNRAKLPAGGQAELLTSGPQSQSWRVRSPEAFQAEFYTFYWLGWQAEAAGQPAEIRPSTPHGMITVALPAGDYEARLFLGSTPPRDFAFALAILAVCCAIAVAWALRGHRTIATLYASAPPLARSEIQGILLGVFAVILLLPLTFREGVAWLDSPPGEALPAQVQSRFIFDDSIELIGYTLNSDSRKPGDPLDLKAYWFARQPTSINYRSFAHLYPAGASSQVLQADKIHPAQAPTSTWTADGYLKDDYYLRLPDDLPAGEYDLRIGLYYCSGAEPCGAFQRAQARDEAGNIIGDSVTLATIQMTAR